MSQLSIIKASAGSGKTFTLAYEYIKLLIHDVNNYKHILAVTFTNKATHEMKTRVLKQLHSLSSGSTSDYRTKLKEDLKLSEEEINRRAGWVLQRILHNYSRFTLETIDSFFQKVIKSFTREIGLNTGYRVELNTDDVLNKAIENLLSDVESEKNLKNWLSSFAYSKVEEGSNWDIKRDLYSLGKQLFNEAYKQYQGAISAKLGDPEFLKAYLEVLKKIEENFETRLSKIAKEIVTGYKQVGLSLSDFSYGKSGFMAYVNRIAERDCSKEPGTRVMQAYESVDKWAKKNSENTELILSHASSKWYALLVQLIDIYEKESIEYNTAQVILKNFYTLGILNHIGKAIEDYSKDENLFLISDSAYFLQGIIGNNDAPFIYEKIGNYYHHFMIDEFQDTSELQYRNFQPLILNSLSQDKSNLLVGDVKQSIYRWRNSNWELLASKAKDDFSTFSIYERSLEVNWRSKENVVQFNNEVFKQAPHDLQQLFNSLIQEKTNWADGFNPQNVIEHIYKGSSQEFKTDKSKSKGFVNAQFHHNDIDESEVLNNLVEQVKALSNAGYELQDIAILVRSAAEGKKVVERLLEENAEANKYSFDVISNESLYLNSSMVIGFIISLLKYIYNPKNSLNNFELLTFYRNLEGVRDNNEKFSTDDKDVSLFKDYALKYSRLTLYEIIENAITNFHLDTQQADHVYLQKLLDVIIEFQEMRGSDLYLFLNYWEEQGESLTISTSENQNAIRVITVHKSKGLEFKAVLIPFCNWSLDHSNFKDNIIWVQPEQEPFNKLGLVPVKYGEKLANTQFAKDYYIEKARAYIDNLNLLYVAFTRAEEVLMVQGTLSYKSDSKELKTKNVADLLLLSLSNSQVYKEKIENLSFTVGQLMSIDAKALVNEIIPLEAQFNVGTVLAQKLNLAYLGKDYFSDDVQENIKAASRGKLMHGIFEQIKDISDISEALNKVCFEGLISEEERTGLENEIKTKINSNKLIAHWFDKSNKVITEKDIYTRNAMAYRPDRIVITKDKTIIIDYKFGAGKGFKDIEQVNAYRGLLKEMGYPNVEAFVWYYQLNEVQRVEIDEKNLRQGTLW